MLADKDIQKLINVFATREEVATKQDLDEFKDEMREDFSKLQTAVDKYAQKADKYFQEMAALSNKIDRPEKQIQLVAAKAGIKLEDI